jgi:hypothetical protein
MSQPQSGARMQPTAEAVGGSWLKKGTSPGGAEEHLLPSSNSCSSAPSGLTFLQLRKSGVNHE